ncbi:MAG TPA: DNA recombination protein RmuC [Vicinamibacteria bacterium]|nr:DNA recombination protein RmuC [Vicinamibacteria bacterium]
MSIFEVSVDVALLALAASGVAGLVMGTLLRFKSTEAREAALADEVRKATELVSKSGAAAGAAEAELAVVRGRLASAQAEAKRLHAEASRIPSLEGKLSELGEELTCTLATLASEQARAGQLPPVEAALRRMQLQQQEAAAEIDSLRLRAGQIPELEAAISRQQSRLDELQAALGEAEQEKACLAIRVEEAGLRNRDLQTLLERAQTSSREAAAALSSEALATGQRAVREAVRTALGEFEERSGARLAASQAAIELLVTPLRDSLAGLHASLHNLERSRLDRAAALERELTALESAQVELRATTEKLGKGLVPRNRLDGWCIPLRRLIDMAGVYEHCQFNGSSEFAATEEPARPEVIVDLPGVRTAAIDAGAPITAYLESLEAEDEAKRRSLLRQHVGRMRDHISQLGDPAYRAQLASSSALVIMYVPLEGALAAALWEDPSLIDHALEHSVLPATPLTLLTHFKAVAWMWP